MLQLFLRKHFMKYTFLLLSYFLLNSCSTPNETTSANNHSKTYTNSIETSNYELILPIAQQKGVLILFPGFPETPANIKTEFKIIEPAIREGIAIVLMKFNQRLWLTTEEKFRLTKTINQLFSSQNLEDDKVYLGGFSSGGNISLLLANHLAETDNIIQPKGVFLIDSPVDLFGLYEVAQRNIARNFSTISVQESKRTITSLEEHFGKPANSFENYELYAPYTHKTNNIQNLTHLNDIKIRLYTEPDIQWWQENRQNEWEDMNAFFIKKLSHSLTKKYGDNVEYIATKNRGYRANGQRHPHSWSIVDINELLKWISII